MTEKIIRLEKTKRRLIFQSEIVNWEIQGCQDNFVNLTLYKFDVS